MHHLPTSSSQCAVHDCAWLGPTYHDAFDGSPRCWPAGSLMQRHAMEQPRQSRHLPCARMTWDRGRPAPGLAIQGSANTLYLHFGTCDARIVLRCNEVRVTHDPGANLCTINNGLRTRVTTPERNNNNTKPPDGRQRQQQQQRRQQICGSLLQRPPAPCANATLTQGSMPSALGRTRSSGHQHHPGCFEGERLPWPWGWPPLPLSIKSRWRRPSGLSGRVSGHMESLRRACVF